jgi:O-methyltransferase involved in polyketide biosynthesis
MAELPDHSKISPTAKMVAYWRQYADLPYSKDIALAFKTEEIVRHIFGDDLTDLRKDFFVPMVEVRYNSIKNYILKNNFKQVLEFASGISLRGLYMTSDSQMVYAETDLPNITIEKTKLVEAIKATHGIKARKNLSFYSVNILNYQEITQALANFSKDKPLLITNEGLFQYLTKEEKSLAAKNIYKILKSYQGAWVTPDFDTWNRFNHVLLLKQEYKKMMDTIKLKTERSFITNSFENENEVISFFENLGFKISFQAQWQPEDILSSLTKETSQDIIDALKNLRLWILTV